MLASAFVGARMLQQRMRAVRRSDHAPAFLAPRDAPVMARRRLNEVKKTGN
jgi:hypothetical protein